MAMGFKEISARYLEPLSQWVMIIGIVALCQPWSMALHSYGVTIILIGLVGFSVFSKIKPAPKEE
jgi:type IV secretory pathway VirB2 component (pilin)